MTKSMHSWNIIRRLLLFTVTPFWNCLPGEPTTIPICGRHSRWPTTLAFHLCHQKPYFVWERNVLQSSCRSWLASVNHDMTLSCFPNALVDGMAVWPCLTNNLGVIVGFPDKWGRLWHSSLLLLFLPVWQIEVMPENKPATLWPWGSSHEWGTKESQQCQCWHHGATKMHASGLKLRNMSEKLIHLFYLP